MLLVEVVGWLWCGIGVTVLGALAWAGIRNWWRKAQDGLDAQIVDAGFTPDYSLRLRPVGRPGRGRVTRPTSPFGRQRQVASGNGEDNQVAPSNFDSPTSQLSTLELSNLLLPDWAEARTATPRYAIAGLPLSDPTIYDRVADELALRNRAIERFG